MRIIPAVVRSARLRNRAKFLLVLVLLMLLPLRALAAVTVGFCALGDEAAAAGPHAAQNAMHGHSQHHEPEPASGEGNGPDCSSCVEHCSSMLTAIPAPCGGMFAAGTSAFPGLERSVTSFVPDSLDPPPVTL